MSGSGHTVKPDQPPFLAEAVRSTADFFPMFEAPFRFGGGWGGSFHEINTLVPLRQISRRQFFVVLSQPGQRAAALRTVSDRLNAANRIRELASARSSAEVRERAYRRDHGLATLIDIVCIVLLAVTAARIVGLASFWVGQRQRQIGVRRALGATSVDILRYFQIGKLLIGLGVVILGSGVALGVDPWLVSHYEMARRSPMYLLGAALIVLVLGKLVVFRPALRASRVPPVIATHAA